MDRERRFERTTQPTKTKERPCQQQRKVHCSSQLSVLLLRCVQCAALGSGTTHRRDALGRTVGAADTVAAALPLPAADDDVDRLHHNTTTSPHVDTSQSMRRSVSAIARRISQPNHTRCLYRPLVRAYNSQPTLRSSIPAKLVGLGSLIALSAAAMSSTVQSASGASETVIKQLNSSVTTFSAPLSRGGAEVGVRMSAIKLANNDLLLYNPTELNEETKAHLQQLGTVRYIVAPNLVHHMFIDPYPATFPGVKLIGPEGISDKKKMAFTEIKDANEGNGYSAQIGWGNDVELQYFPDFVHKEIMLYHRPTKTLFVADMLWNLPANESYERVVDKTRVPTKHSQFSAQYAVDHYMHPDGWMAKALQWASNKQTDQLKAGLKKVVNEWQAATIVMQHGDVITSGAHEKLESTYSWIKQ